MSAIEMIGRRICWAARDPGLHWGGMLLLHAVWQSDREDDWIVVALRVLHQCSVQAMPGQGMLLMGTVYCGKQDLTLQLDIFAPEA